MINLSFSGLLRTSITGSNIKALGKSVRSDWSDRDFIVIMIKCLRFVSVRVSVISSINWLGSLSWGRRNKSGCRLSLCFGGDVSASHNSWYSWASDSVWRSSISNSYGL